MQGKIVRWNEERGFGFVKEEITGTEIFIHISTLNIRNPPPEIGEEIDFETTFDDKKGKTEVKKAVYLNRTAPLYVKKEQHKYSYTNSNSEVSNKYNFETWFNEENGKTKVQKPVYLNRTAPLYVKKEQHKYSHTNSNSEVSNKYNFETWFNEENGKTKVQKPVYLNRTAPSSKKERKKYSSNRQSYQQKTDNMLGLLLLIVIIIVLSYFFVFKVNNQDSIVEQQDITVHSVPSDNSDEIHRLFTQQQNNVFITGRGEVQKVLHDDNEGARHQRFILQLSNGQTLLIAHNIDLADRLPNLQKGDEVSFAGDYIYNDKGGLIHWTHKDPRGQHKDGYLMYQGKIYQ
ncbi:MAG: DUF3465 domain-containing protein [Cardiobacteriaceae bacterium]|nr:DUF3465 domain-containing protein [Cardiobacteriaceae bacterium]